MTNSPIRAGKARAWIANFLLLAGAAGVGAWGWSVLFRCFTQSRENRAFDQRAHGVLPHSPAAPRPENGAPIGRLAIPRLHLRAMVLEGAGDDTLAVALGHVPGTALPGQTGNVAIAGHRDTFFRCLRNISKNDVIVLQTIHGSYTYRVEGTAVVKPRDVAVLAPGSYSEITLITCYPFHYVGPAPDRFIVRARLNYPPPWKKLLSPRIKSATLHSGISFPGE
jgi:LPXTG-site transpeptidase (sortase) family protein